MIAPSRITATSLRGRILAVIADADEPPDARDIAGLVLPVPFPRMPTLRLYGLPGDVVARHQREKAALYARWQEEKAAAARKVSREIGRLTEAGLVSEMVPPHASPLWWSLRVRLSRAETLTRLGDGADPLDHEDEEEGEEEDPDMPTTLVDAQAPPAVALPLVEIIMAKVEQPPGVASTRELLGAKPSGAHWRAYAHLSDIGALVAPTQRQITLTGAALVESWRLRIAA